MESRSPKRKADYDPLEDQLAVSASVALDLTVRDIKQARAILARSGDGSGGVAKDKIKDPKLRAYIAALTREAALRAGLTLDNVIARIDDAARRARETGKTSVEVGALAALARLLDRGEKLEIGTAEKQPFSTERTERDDEAYEEETEGEEPPAAENEREPETEEVYAD